jgi:hypothetical protein
MDMRMATFSESNPPALNENGKRQTANFNQTANGETARVCVCDILCCLPFVV